MSFRITPAAAITTDNMTTTATEATPPWNIATNYANAAEVSKGKRIWLSLHAANLGHDPELDVAEDHWKNIGPTNDWAMFDDQIDTQTIMPDEIEFEHTPDQRVDRLGLFKVDAASVNVTVTKDGDELQNRDFSMVNYLGIANYWDHFFNQVTRKRTLIVADLPILSGITITVRIDNAGSNAAAGHYVTGRSRDIGNAVYGATLGYLSFSRFAADEFGRREVVKRTGKKEGTFDVWIKKAYVDSTYDLVTSLDAQAVLITATEEYSTAAFFGLITQAPITISYPDFSVMRFTVEDF